MYLKILDMILSTKTGLYATPSINGRLKKEGFISALVKNKKKDDLLNGYS